MTHAEFIITKTMEQVERNYRIAETMVESVATQRTLFDQAFGMVQLAVVLLPTEEFGAINDLWDEYKPKFESLVYGI